MVYRCLFLLTCLGSSFLSADPESTSLPAQETYSLHDCKGRPLDLKLVDLLNKRGGFFIEAGAFNGIEQSNTYLLEKNYGWRGILIEPSRPIFARLCLNRPASTCFNCALGPFEQDDTLCFGDFDGHIMASIGGKRLKREPAQCVLFRSLQSILDEEGVSHADLLVLDTEGSEYNVLRGIDFTKTTFDYLLIDIHEWAIHLVCSLLFQNGYDLVECFTSYNPTDNPAWDGLHNDYLFKRRGLSSPEQGVLNDL